jgi:hypothetical protein
MVRRVSPVCARFSLAPLLAALLLTTLLVAVLLAPAAAQAQSQPVLARARGWVARLKDRLTAPGGNALRFGRDLVIDSGENRDQVACFLCSTHIDGTVQGNLVVFAGNTYLNGPVHGDVVELGGRVTLTGKARIGGDLVIFGGRLEQDAASTIGRKRWIIGPIVFLPMVLMIAILIAGLVFLLRVVFGRSGTQY